MQAMTAHHLRYTSSWACCGAIEEEHVSAVSRSGQESMQSPTVVRHPLYTAHPSSIALPNERTRGGLMNPPMKTRAAFLALALILPLAALSSGCATTRGDGKAPAEESDTANDPL